MSAIHENIKHLRQVRGLTQADVADAIGVTRQTVSSYESGRTQPDLETLKLLAELYQADLQDILYGGNRLQRRLKVLRRTACGLIALLFFGLLAHSILLWIANTYFATASGVVTEITGPVLTTRFALLRASETISNIWTALFNLGCLILLYFLFRLKHTLPLYIGLGWFLSLTVTSVIVTAPWAMFDNIYSYINYLLPLYSILPYILLVFLGFCALSFIRRRKAKKNP